MATYGVLDSGTCGDCSWEIDGWSDYDTNPNHYVVTIYITGSGSAYFDIDPDTGLYINPWSSWVARISKVYVEDGVTQLDTFEAFNGNSSITLIELPDTLEYIGEYVFYRCGSSSSSLAITIPSSVTALGQFAFYGCNCRTMTVNANITTIPGGCFASMQYCRRFTLATTEVTYIGDEAFEYMGQGYYASYGYLTVFDAEFPYVTYVGASAFLSAYIGGTIDSSTGSQNGYAIELPRVETIELKAFQGCSLYGVLTLPSSLTSIGEYAFYNAGQLYTVYYKANVTYVPSYCFARCFKLQYVQIDEGVLGINEYAFQLTGSTSYSGTGTTFMIPNSCTGISAGKAFEDAESLIVIDNYYGSIPSDYTTTPNHWGLNGTVVYLRTQKIGLDSAQFYKKTSNGIYKMTFYIKTSSGVASMYWYKTKLVNA